MEFRTKSGGQQLDDEHIRSLKARRLNASKTAKEQESQGPGKKLVTVEFGFNGIALNGSEVLSKADVEALGINCEKTKELFDLVLSRAKQLIENNDPDKKPSLKVEVPTKSTPTSGRPLFDQKMQDEWPC